jgi:glycosyltransferase involved in cell wall biosynthesis
VGQEIGRRYGHRPQVLVMSDPVVRAEDVAPGPPRRDWSGETRLLTVGRMDPEKNPLLLVRALAELEREEPGRYVLSWIGSGPLEDEVRGLASALGVADRLELLGWMPFDQALLDRYRQAHLFVHVSLTEGVPRVLYEALACGTPIVATDVGGVARALDDGEAALLVPPDNLDALLAAIRRLAGDAELRDRLVVHGLELVRDRTLEGEAARAAAFIAGPEAAPAVEVGAAI